MITVPEILVYTMPMLHHKELRCYLRRVGLDNRPIGEIVSATGWDRAAVSLLMARPPALDLSGEGVFELTAADVVGKSLPDAKRAIRCAVLPKLAELSVLRVRPVTPSDDGVSIRKLSSFTGESDQPIRDCRRRARMKKEASNRGP